MARLQRAAHRDPAVSLAFHQVANLLAAPGSLLHPRVAWRVLRGSLSRSRGHGRPTPRARIGLHGCRTPLALYRAV
jgi:hypothetical protein